MQEKIIIVLAIAGLVAGFSFVQNFWQQQQVRDSLREILNPNNQHTFKNRQGLEDAMYDAAHKIVGDKGDPAIEIYHYVGTTYVENVDVADLPKYGGVKVEGGNVKLSALVGRVWWYQYTLWNKNWRKDVEITKAVFVDERWVGAMYTRPPSAEFDFVDEPWLLLDASK